MKSKMQSVGRIPAILAILIQVSLPVSEAMAQPTQESRKLYLQGLWDNQESWLDLGSRKALRSTSQVDRWAVLVQFEEGGKWHQQGFLHEISHTYLSPPEGLQESLKATFDGFEPSLIVGETRSSSGGMVYVVGVVLRNVGLSDSAGRALLQLVPLNATETLTDANGFVAAYLDLLHSTPRFEEPDIYPAGACETACSFQRQASLDQCDVSYAACGAAATAIFVQCALACGGIPICEAACLALAVTQIGLCVLANNSCVQTADQFYEICLGNCSTCSAVATETATAVLSLGDVTAGGLELASTGISHALARAEPRGQESFIMDEWAVVQSGRVTASSAPAFAQAVLQQGAVPGSGSFLVVQEPVHVMNSRHVPKPEVQIFSTGLAPSERGDGQLVAARLELSPGKVVDRVEIVYTSEPMDEARLKHLVTLRVGLVFASEQQHRTAVYVVFRLTDRFEVVGTFTALPQCCCGEVICM